MNVRMPRRWRPSLLMIAVVMTLGLGLGWGPTASAAEGGDASPRLAQAREAIGRGDYEAAVRSLTQVVQESPGDADALNLMGYSLRKSGDRENALAFYQRALAAKPKHRAANEYLGELYLEMDQLAKAEERLKVLDGACFFGCKEYDDLKSAIADYRRRKGLK